MTVLPFGEYLPDIADLGNEGLLTADNCLPQARGYRSAPSLVTYTGPSALSARIVGAFAAKDKANNTYNYAATVGSGTDGKIYVLSGGAWSDASGSGFAIPEGETVEFVKWGEKVLATTIGAPVQEIAFGGSTFGDSIVSSRKPQARRIAVLRDFVVLGDIDDVGNDGVARSRVWWSGIDDNTTFEDGTGTTQSDFQNLPNGGAVQKVIGGEVGRVFCESSIYLMTYLGYSPWFRFDEVEINRGVWVPESVAVIGNTVIFLDRDGWYKHEGQASVPIGYNKIDQTFLADFDPNFAHRCSTVIDPLRKLYFFAYVSVDAIAGMPNRVLVYDLINAKWTVLKISVEWFTIFFGEGYTVDTLDTLSGSIDDLTASLDSPTYQSKGLELAAFNSSHQLGVFRGPALDATFMTGERQIIGPSSTRTMLSGVRPLIDGEATVTAQAYKRNLESETPTPGALVTMNSLGNCPMRENARYHRIEVKTSGEFNHALGVDVDATATAGKR